MDDNSFFEDISFEANSDEESDVEAAEEMKEYMDQLHKDQIFYDRIKKLPPDIKLKILSSIIDPKKPQLKHALKYLKNLPRDPDEDEMLMGYMKDDYYTSPDWRRVSNAMVRSELVPLRDVLLDEIKELSLIRNRIVNEPGSSADHALLPETQDTDDEGDSWEECVKRASKKGNK